MYRKGLGLFLLLATLVLPNLGLAAFIEPQTETDTEAAHVVSYDLSGDGQHMLSEQIEDRRAKLGYNGVVFYERDQESFQQLLVGDVDADGAQEAIIIECDQTTKPNQVRYLLYGLTGQGWEHLDTVLLPYDASVRSMLVELVHGGQQFLLGISRTPEEFGLSYVDGYWLFRVIHDEASHKRRFGLVRQANPVKMVHLKIENGSLIEKHGVFPEDSLWPQSIKRVYYGWDGKNLVELKQETVDHYYLEELCLPELFEQVAREQGIPVEILKAVAQQESGGRQFDYGDYKISFDGGTGLMQVTPREGQVQINHLGLTYSGEDIERLKWDTYFNLTVGAQILRDKWLGAFGTNAVLPRVGASDPAGLESWYFALWAYNGYVKINFPGEIWGGAYQEKVIGYLPAFSRDGFAYPAFIHWNQGDNLPSASSVYPVQQLTNGTLPQFTPGANVVLSQGCNLRSDPAVYPSRLGILGAGSQLRIVSDTGESMLEVHVEYDTNGLLTDLDGFVSRDYIEVSAQGTIAKSAVNLRSTPEIPTTKLGSLNAGDIIRVISIDAPNWMRIEVEQSSQPEQAGLDCYVARLSGTGLEDSALLPGDQIVLQGMINLRSYPSSTSEEYYSNVVGRLPAGQVVEVISGPQFNFYDGYLWYEIKAEEQTGFAAAGLFRVDSNPGELFCTLDKPRLQSGRVVATGISKPGVVVQLLSNGQPLGSTMTDPTGGYSLSLGSLTTPVVLQARAFDQRGGRSVLSPEVEWEQQALTSVYTVIDSSTYSVNDGKATAFNGQTAFRSGGGVTVMAIHLFRELGAGVSYNNGRITISYNGITVRLTQGTSVMQIETVAGFRQVELRAPILNVGGRTYIPTRDVSENLGCDVFWNKGTDSITIIAK